MSFAIALIDKQGTMMVAADQKASSKSGKAQYADTEKIIEITPQSSIAFTGDYEIAKAIVQDFAKRFDATWTIQQAMSCLKYVASVYDTAYLKRWKQHADCTFILAHQAQEIPNIALLTLAEGKPQIFPEPLSAWGYRFFFSNPLDVSFDQCLQLCRSKLLSADHKSTKELLIDIVHSVADQSQYVNHHVQTWPLEI